MGSHDGRHGRDVEQTLPGTFWLAGFYKEHRVTDLYDGTCPEQPKGDQIPVLKVSKPLKPPKPPGGCTYESFARSRSGKTLGNELPELNTIELYRQALKENVHVRAQDKGSHHAGGVVIGEDKERRKIFIATDNHVINSYLLDSSEPKPEDVQYTVTMPDGSEHQAKVRLVDEANQMAVLSIDADPKLVGTYKVADLVDAPKASRNKLSGTGMIFGFPTASSTLYATRVDFQGIHPANNVYNKFLEGEPHDRPVLKMKEIDSHTADGESGNAVYNKRGRLLALFEGWIQPEDNDSPIRRRIFANPINARLVKHWLKQINAGFGWPTTNHSRYNSKT